MKKIFLVILCFTLILNTVGCSSNSQTNKIIDDKKDEQDEISILIWERNYDKSLLLYTEDFEQKKGVKINFDVIQTNTFADYENKLNAKLYLKNGPTLIYIPGNQLYKKYTDQGVALEVTEKLPNLSKIYDGLIDKKVYFVPIMMQYTCTMLNRNVLDDLGIKDPDLNWTIEEYLQIKEKWISKEPRYFTRQDYVEIVKNPLYSVKILNDNEEIILNTNEVKNYIAKAREQIFSGKYILDNNYYTFEDYYKIFLEGFGTKEYEKAMAFDLVNDEKMLSRSFTRYAFQTKYVSDGMDKNDTIILPKANQFSNWVYTDGFLVNSNGKNIRLGIEFINDMLEDDTQLLIYNNRNEKGKYPVNKEIADEIDRREIEQKINERATELRKYVLKQIEKGLVKPYNQGKAVDFQIYEMLEKDLFKFIFIKGEYTDEELAEELQKLEVKYNTWLNE